MSAKITAIKDGRTKEFTKVAWDLLGKDKGGWVLVPNEATKKKESKKEEKKTATPIADAKKVSSDFTVDAAIVEMKKLTKVSDVEVFVKDDTRSSLKKVADKYITELNEGNDSSEEATEE